MRRDLRGPGGGGEAAEVELARAEWRRQFPEEAERADSDWPAEEGEDVPDSELEWAGGIETPLRRIRPEDGMGWTDFGPK